MAEQREPPDEAPGAASPAAGSGSSAKKVPAGLADTNGDLASAAKETAAHAKSAVAGASNPVSGPIPVPPDGPAPSRLPLAAAIATGVLAVLMVLLARRQAGDD